LAAWPTGLHNREGVGAAHRGGRRCGVECVDGWRSVERVCMRKVVDPCMLALAIAR
jgi:hypothetical protein